MVKLLGMPGVDKNEEGLIFGVGEGLISFFHHMVGKKIREVWGDGGKKR